MLNQLVSGTKPEEIVTKTDLGQWHLVAFFLRKIIPVEIQYKTHNSKFLAIVKAFKIWHHYLENCKYNVFILTDLNNLCHFMDTKSLSSRQVYWAQELFYYHFQIDYCQNKANTTADALSQFLQKSQNEEDELQAKND